VLRSTQGAIFALNLIEQDIMSFLDQHPKYYVYGTNLAGDCLSSMKQSDYVALVLGNEGSGITEDVLARTNQNLTIKIAEIDSLNVAVAGSILMHHLAK